MSFSDTVKAELSKAEVAAHNAASAFFAKLFTGKTLAIVAGVAFVLGLVIHLL